MPSHRNKKPTSEAAAAEAAAAVQDNKTALKKADEQRVVASWLSSSLKQTSSASNRIGSSHETLASGTIQNGHATSTSGTSITMNTAQEPSQESDASSAFSLDLNETGGLGFSDPQSSTSNGNTFTNINDRMNASANDKLRSQLLGSAAAKNFKAMQRARVQGTVNGNGNGINSGLVASKPMPSSGRGAGAKGGKGGRGRGKGEESDDEEGRTGITGSTSRIKASKGASASILESGNVPPGETKFDDEIRNAGQDTPEPTTNTAAIIASQPHPPSSSLSSRKLSKRPASYMDELLAKRNKKKKK